MSGSVPAGVPPCAPRHRLCCLACRAPAARAARGMRLAARRAALARRLSAAPRAPRAGAGSRRGSTTRARRPGGRALPPACAAWRALSPASPPAGHRSSSPTWRQQHEQQQGAGGGGALGRRLAPRAPRCWRVAPWRAARTRARASPVSRGRACWTAAFRRAAGGRAPAAWPSWRRAVAAWRQAGARRADLVLAAPLLRARPPFVPALFIVYFC